MNTKMHGKPIAKIIFDGASSYQIYEIHSDGDVQLELSATHHGEFDQFWIVKKVKGVETERFNPRLVETIVWADSALGRAP
jgi:hypothetical protein